MYENLLAQDGARASLIGDIESGSVPPALLFSGPPASGKLTAALETARILSCTRKGAWNCSCSDCARHRLLIHGDLLLLGKRSFPEEIIVAREFLLRSPGQASAYFFLRSIQKLLARFNPALWSGEETKLGKAVPLMQSIEEALDLIDPEGLGGEIPATIAKAVESAYSDALSLEPFAPEAPGVFMIRNMEVWAQLAPAGRRKTVIIENADRMQDSARNAMLKILEEPPETVRFILLTSRRASMLATILSRSRLYSFAPRDGAATALVLSRVFKSDEMAPSLQSYLESRIPFPPQLARVHAERFAGRILADLTDKSPAIGPFGRAIAQEAALAGKSIAELLDELGEATGGFGSKDKAMAGSFVQFIKALLSVFSDLLKESAGEPAIVALVDRWSRLAREAAVQYGSLNRNPDLLVKVLATSFGDSI
ncbi:MAG: DNA polymerase III [Spirochaetales bacterium]|jgi:DNA polymerase-3 subunit gamma/tau